MSSEEKPKTPPGASKIPFDPVHPPPSLPTSPLPKRSKLADDPMASLPTGATPIPALPGAPKPPHAEPALPAIDGGSTGSAAPLPSVNALVEPRNSPATAQLIRHEDMLLATSPLQVARLSDKARVPTRGSALAAGYDLYSAKQTSIPAGGRALVPTDLAIATPPGTYGRVAPRSGLSVKKGLATGAGVIDADYRGHVMVLLLNHSDADVVVDEGERCAQLILERYVGADVVDVTAGVAGPAVDMERAKGLASTDRGAGGFGSTGVN